MRNTTSVIKTIVIKWRFSTYWGRAGVQVKNVLVNNFHLRTSK